jgi:hypothetical protein
MTLQLRNGFRLVKTLGTQLTIWLLQAAAVAVGKELRAAVEVELVVCYQQQHL